MCDRNRFQGKFVNKKLTKQDSEESFSSFESPPSDIQENFSDHDMAENKDIVENEIPLQSINRIKIEDQIEAKNALTEQIQKGIAKNRKILEKINKDKRQQERATNNKFTYMKNVSLELKEIREESEQNMSISQSPYRQRQIVKNSSIKNVDHRKVDNTHQSLLIKNLQQQNEELRVKVRVLENDLLQKTQQNLLIEKHLQQYKVQILESQKMIELTRKETKIKLMEQVEKLREKCGQMKNEMELVKGKYDDILKKIAIQREYQQNKIQQLLELNQYQHKFVEVFLNMIQKLKIFEIQPSWPQKKRIAIGWKIVKTLVKKALKSGIKVPTIIDKQQLNFTQFC